MRIQAREVGVGLIGTGWGALHARVIASLPGRFALRSVCSQRIDRAVALRDETASKAVATSDWGAVLDRDDVDLVVVAAPDYLHAEIAHAAIARGKHVYCEKPLARSAAEAAEVLAAAKQARVAHFSGFTWRFAPAVATIRRLVEAGSLGQAYLVDARFSLGPPRPDRAWQYDAAQRVGGALGNLGSHLIDLARYLGSGSGPPLSPGDAGAWRVWATCVRPRAGGQAASLESAWLHLEMGVESGAHVRLQATQTTEVRLEPAFEVAVHGSRASALAQVSLRSGSQVVRRIDESGPSEEPVEPVIGPATNQAAEAAGLRQSASASLLIPTLHQMYALHVWPRITGAMEPAFGTPTFEDGCIVQAVVDAALESERVGSRLPVTLPAR